MQLSIEQFRDLRESDNRYAIVTGHPFLDGERILEVDDGVTIVESLNRRLSDSLAGRRPRATEGD